MAPNTERPSASRTMRGRTPTVDEWYLRNHGHTRHMEVLATAFNAVPLQVVNTRRIATIQRRLAEYYAALLPIRLVPAPIELPVLVETVQWHRLFDADPGILWLRSLLRDSVHRAAG